MSINIDTETVVTLREASRGLPRLRRGRHLHASTLFRWASKGRNGVRLETIKIGGTTCTSAEALRRFFDRLSASGAEVANLPARPQPRRNRGSEAELDRRGF